MDCDDAEEACDLLRHKNSNVTRAVYRAHFSAKRREALRARIGARHGATVEAPVEATDLSPARQTEGAGNGNVAPLRGIAADGG
jgi:hypothetical protein